MQKEGHHIFYYQGLMPPLNSGRFAGYVDLSDYDKMIEDDDE